MTDDEVFANDVRKDIGDLVDAYGLEEHDMDGGRLLVGGDMTLMLRTCRLDIDTGKMIGTMRVDTPDITVEMVVSEVVIRERFFDLVGKYEEETVRVDVPPSQ